MKTAVFEELLENSKCQISIAGLRRFILDAALRGEFDKPAEREVQTREALRNIHSSAAFTKKKRDQGRKINAEDINDVFFGRDSENETFIVMLGDVAKIEKGKTGIKDAQPGEYPLVVTAEGRLSADHFDFEGPAVIIPLVSSTGHGDASLKRIHYQDGKYAVGTILCVVQSRYPNLVHPRYLYEYLSIFKDELLVARMSGTANVSLTVKSLDDVPVPLITFDAQIKLERLMRLCDALEEKGRLEHTQHQQLLQAMLDSLTQTSSAPELSQNWQRLAQHFDLLIDRPEAVDALEQTILQLAVRGLLVPQDPSDEPASELLKKIRAEKDRLIAEGKIKKDKPLPAITEEEMPFELPAGWDWFKVANVFETISGGTFAPEMEKDSGTYMYVKVGDMNLAGNEYSITTSSRFIDPDEKYLKSLIPTGSIIFPKRGGAIATNKKRVVVDPIFVDLNTMAITPIVIPTEYAFLWLMTIDLASLNTGTSVPQINHKDIDPLSFPLPPLAEQSRIVARVTELRALCQQLREKLTQARTTQTQLAQAWVEQVAA